MRLSKLPDKRLHNKGGNMREPGGDGGIKAVNTLMDFVTITVGRVVENPDRRNLFIILYPPQDLQETFSRGKTGESGIPSFR
jgi:hypothetical protein